jgi:hypothetical protein
LSKLITKATRVAALGVGRVLPHQHAGHREKLWRDYDKLRLKGASPAQLNRLKERFEL